MKSRTVKWILFVGSVVFVVLAALGFVWFRQLENAHQHCIKVTGIAFRQYADDHDNLLPYHTNGFGDALLLLVKEQYLPGTAYICGPGDDGMVLSNALVNGLDVPEDECSRIYVPGLSATNDPMICILFDRRSVRGGDHFYGLGRPLREVCMLDGSMRTVLDEEWREFSRQQVALLVAAGWPREKALEYYPRAASDR